MKVLAALCMVALAVSHPVNDAVSGHVAIKSDGNQTPNEHLIHKRSVQSHPVNDAESGHVAIKSDDGTPITNEHLIHKRSVQSDDAIVEKVDHKNVHENIIQKRDVQDIGDTVPAECSEGSEAAGCGEQNVNDHAIQKRDTQNVDDHVIQKRDAQNVEGVANQNDNIQEAWSNEGGYAKQGEGGQYVYASDFGGPIVQILQHVYKSNCCECGCDCGCPGDDTVTTTEASEQI